MNGYQALRENAAYYDASARGKVRATGEDRKRLLHAMTTNDVQRLEAGQGVYVFFLNAQGRILGDAYIWAFADSLLLDTEAELAPKLMEHLDRFIIADDVSLADETGLWAEIEIIGPKSAEALKKLDIPVPAEGRFETWRSGFSAAASTTGKGGYRILLPASGKEEWIAAAEAAGLTAADAEAVEAVRLEQGTPRYGTDISERFLTQETGQMQAISFTKGCYIGQEIVERVRSRAQIHRQLTPLTITGTNEVAPGTKLQADGKDVGEITSAAFSPALNAVVALAYVRVEQRQANTPMSVAEAPGAIATMRPAA